MERSSALIISLGGEKAIPDGCLQFSSASLLSFGGLPAASVLGHSAGPREFPRVPGLDCGVIFSMRGSPLLFALGVQGIFSAQLNLLGDEDSRGHEAVPRGHRLSGAPSSLAERDIPPGGIPSSHAPCSEGPRFRPQAMFSDAVWLCSSHVTSLSLGLILKNVSIFLALLCEHQKEK